MSDRDRTRLGLDAALGPLRVRAGLDHRLLRLADGCRDALVEGADLPHVVELVEQLVEAPRREDDVERIGLVRLVDRDESLVSPFDRKRVLLAQER